MFELFKRKAKPAAPTAGRAAMHGPADFARALGRWMTVPMAPSEKSPSSFVGFVYFDAHAGLSARGGPLGSKFVEQPSMTLRLPLAAAELLADDEVAAWKLPARPPWLTPEGVQASAPWRNDPALVGQFHPSFINDVQIIVHDGEPRRTGKKPELCWVRVGGVEQGPRRRFLHSAAASTHAFDGTVYLATLLNQPHLLTSVKQGDALCFYADVSANSPLLVSTAYLAERAAWRVQPCDRCGLCEGFDPPSLMAKTRFPDTPAGVEMLTFTALCAVCGGSQLWTHEKA